jgi:homopolymeric O-antigen transport system ATP-binding protein
MVSSITKKRSLPKLSSSEDSAVVVCCGIVKEFYHYTHRTTSLREFFIRSMLQRPIHERRATFVLQDFNLRVETGEAVAFIGPNGSGKSTALRLIAGIYVPTQGSIETRGRVAPVIGLGASFNPELSGAENVALYGAVMGLTRREIVARYPEIVDFSGIGDFIREPLKYYSSGMQARLAFSVAACVDPDTLLLDEVLAVGDASFRERCVDRLRRFHANGRTLLVVSHDLEMVSGLCQRAVWLEDGRIRMDGEIGEVVSAYRATVQ